MHPHKFRRLLLIIVPSFFTDILEVRPTVINEYEILLQIENLVVSIPPYRFLETSNK
jgi:hypothetical protein